MLSNNTGRPSALIEGLAEEPLTSEPPELTATRSVVPASRSWMKTSAVAFLSPGTRFVGVGSRSGNDHARFPPGPGRNGNGPSHALRCRSRRAEGRSPPPPSSHGRSMWRRMRYSSGAVDLGDRPTPRQVPQRRSGVRERQAADGTFIRSRYDPTEMKLAVVDGHAPSTRPRATSATPCRARGSMRRSRRFKRQGMLS